MPNFGRRSKEKLATVDPRLVSILSEVIKHVDFTVLTGTRGREAQMDAVHEGRSKKPWPKSTHNCVLPTEGLPPEQWPEDPEGLSRAVDIAPWQDGIDWDDEPQFAFLAGQVVAEARHQGIDIRWGGDWDGDGQGVWRDSDERFNDMPHFEVIG